MRDELKNFSGVPLSAETQRALEEFITEQDGVFVISLPNVQPPSVEGCNPTGMVVLVKRDQMAETSLLPENMFGVIAAFEICNFKTISKETFLAKFDEHAREIASKLGDGPSIDDITVYGQRKNIGKDRRQWSPTLGKGTWTISEYKQDKYKRRHFITIEIPEVKLSEDFHNFVESTTPDLQHSTATHTTMQEIYDSAEYRVCAITAKRNACRVAGTIASALGLELNERPDLQAFPNDKQLHLPVPSYLTLRNHMSPTTILQETFHDAKVHERTDEGLAIYHEGGSMRESHNGAMIKLSPMEGILIFNQSTNSAAHCIPSSVGTVSAERSIAPEELEHITERFFWPGRSTRSLSPSLRAQYKTEQDFVKLDFIRNLNSRMHLKPLATYMSE